MSGSSVDISTIDDARENLNVLRSVSGKVVEVIENATSTDLLEYLIDEQQLDVYHEGNQGVGPIRRAVLTSSYATPELKRTVITRGDDTPDTVLVPDELERNARVALKTGKPVVLYGPTGTGKTTFAKQLALRHCVGYSLHTATPSWTAKDIIGGIGPNLSRSGMGSINYQTELGAVTQGVQRAREFDIPYGVILDEITRADIERWQGEREARGEAYGTSKRSLGALKTLLAHAAERKVMSANPLAGVKLQKPAMTDDDMAEAAYLHSHSIIGDNLE